MKLKIVILSMIALAAFYSCDDDESGKTGTLAVEYEEGKWTPGKLTLFNLIEPTKVVKEISTSGYKTVNVKTPAGNYILKAPDGGAELRITIPEDKTIRVLYSRKGLRLLN